MVYVYIILVNKEGYIVDKKERRENTESEKVYFSKFWNAFTVHIVLYYKIFNFQVKFCYIAINFLRLFRI